MELSEEEDEVANYNAKLNEQQQNDDNDKEQEEEGNAYETGFCFYILYSNTYFKICNVCNIFRFIFAQKDLLWKELPF